MMELRPYQRDCLQALLQARPRGIHRGLVQLPTGTGKTVIFAQLPRYTSKRTLILAHREELLEQARVQLQRANPSAQIELEQGPHQASPDASIVLASVPSLGKAGSQRLTRFHPDTFELIICDEAHHSVAETYQTVFRHFQVWTDPNKFLVGFTATPQRADEISLETVYQEILYRKDLPEMIAASWLCPVAAYRYKTDTSLESVRVRGGDFAPQQLALTVNTLARNEQVLRAYVEKLEKKKTLVFCVDVAHSYALADLFRYWGVPARAVSGRTPAAKRQEILRAFRSGRLSVLTNCEVLTEGFDEPSIEALLMARPTRSPLLYMQMIGRGLRRSPRKDQLVVIDLVDNSQEHSLMTAPVLFGLPAVFDGEGQNLLRAAQRLEALGERYDVDWSCYESLSALEAAVRQLTEVDLFHPVIAPEVERYSRLTWLRVPDGYKVAWSESLGSGESVRRCGLKIRRNLLGQWELQQRVNDLSPENLAVFAQLSEAFAAGDHYVERNSGAVPLLLRRARWRSDAPTEKQVETLKKLGIPFDRATLTKGEAALRISNFFAHKKVGRH